jgi:hypothetical protein
MGATEEQMEMLSAHDVTHVSYILILYSVAFMLYLFVNILLHIYAVHTWPEEADTGRRSSSRAVSTAKRYSSAPGMNGSAHGNGGLKVPKHRPTDSQQVRDAEEFELEGLISDVDDVPSPKDVEIPSRSESRAGVLLP